MSYYHGIDERVFELEMPSELRRVVTRQDSGAEIRRAGGLVFPLTVHKVLPQPGAMLAPRGELAVARHVSTLIDTRQSD